VTAMSRNVGRAPKRRAVSSASHCETCAADLAFLLRDDRPEYERAPDQIRVVDLFAGGGGLTIGAAEAARRVGMGTTVALAVENAAAADVYALNFPDANLVRSDVVELFGGPVGTHVTGAERKVAREVGAVDLLLAGPPCQGHSDLNNHTRRTDPRNALYLRAARAAEVLSPTFVVIENVPAVQRDKGDVVALSTAALEAVGYTVASKVLDLVRFGVPQRRRRHILLAVLGDLVDPAVILDMRSPCDEHDERSVRWAIADLVSQTAASGPDAASIPTAVNLARMQWLIDQDEYDLPNPMRPKCHHDDSHTYNSMYGRLAWDDPAPTITTGFGSMGQGRFVHPAKPRTITPHEAARLQTLPDFFDLDMTKGRGAWATVIGNAVPPLVGVHLVEPLLCSLPRDVAGTATKATRRSGMRVPKDTPGRRRNGIPAASSELIRVRMTNTKRRDTKPELALRSALHAMGLRFSVDRPIPGTRCRADIVFPTGRVAIYVDGCFWHSCPQHGTVPKQNRQWWVDKLAANRRRDDDTDAGLQADGWTVLRFWEHDDPLAAARQVRDAVLQRRASHAVGGRRAR
jgi:DNA (cytosine-5)-methyltransferase 1